MLIKVWPLYGQYRPGVLPWPPSACWLEITHAEDRVKCYRDEDCPLSWKGFSEPYSVIVRPYGFVDFQEESEGSLEPQRDK